MSTPDPTTEQEEVALLKEITASEPWLLPKELFFTSGSKTDSREPLTRVGFRIVTANNFPKFRELFYLATSWPEGWTRVYQNITQLIEIRDSAGCVKLLISYSYEDNYARLVIPDSNWVKQRR